MGGVKKMRGGKSSQPGTLGKAKGKRTFEGAGAVFPPLSKKSKTKVASLSDDSELEEEAPKVAANQRKSPFGKASKITKKVESSDQDILSESDDGSDSEDEPQTKMPLPKGKKTKAPSGKKMESSDEDSPVEGDDDSDSEEDYNPKPSKARKGIKTSTNKLEDSDDDEASLSESEESDFEDEPKKKTKVIKTTPSKEDSSEEDSAEDSDDGSDSDDVPRSKKKPAKMMKKAAAKAPAKKVVGSSEDSSDDEMIMESGGSSKDDNSGESEDEAPLPKKKSAGKSPAGGSCTVFVKNLAWKANEKSIQEFFSDVADFKELRLAKDSEGKLKGFGHVEFFSEDAAKKACEKNGEELFGREVFIELARERTPSSGGQQDFKSPQGGSSGSSNGNTAFVKGFDKFQDEDTIRGSLKKLFSSCGTVQNIRIPVDRESGDIKGFAYIEFKEKEGVAKATELSGEELNGRSIYVDEAGQGGSSGGGRGGGRGGRRGGGRGGGGFGGRGRGEGRGGRGGRRGGGRR